MLKTKDFLNKVCETISSLVAENKIKNNGDASASPSLFLVEHQKPSNPILLLFNSSFVGA